MKHDGWDTRLEIVYCSLDWTTAYTCIAVGLINDNQSISSIEYAKPINRMASCSRLQVQSWIFSSFTSDFSNILCAVNLKVLGL